jgi:hypothetical protein
MTPRRPGGRRATQPIHAAGASVQNALGESLPLSFHVPSQRGYAPGAGNECGAYRDSYRLTGDDGGWCAASLEAVRRARQGLGGAEGRGERSLQMEGS